ncbi:MAG TPA: UDP-galactopyranose mutase [Puia sp.]|nr:UDP-galactopyranose mutase [Puia sp.]
MDLQEFSFVVVGSGLLGAVVAENIAGKLDQKVLVIEKRQHIGGNCYSETDPATGIEVHRYGTHIFHTSRENVWRYIRRFTSFNTYRHQVLSSYKNKIYQFPINLETINSFYNVNLRPYEVDDFMSKIRGRQIKEPANFEEQAISLLGRDLYEAFFKDYTLKQWQIDPKDLPASIFNRLPFRKNYVENYFFDHWQGIPENGYTALFQNLLSHKKIAVLTDTDFFAIRDQLKKDACIIYSGPIDRYFDYKFGRLTWRTLQFEKEVVDTEDYQGNSVINYPEKDIPYTRIHEPRHLHPERNYTKEKTVIFREYSLPDNGTAPFYPIASRENMEKLRLYKTEAGRLENVFISGRLGDYKYYDMDQTIERALEIVETGILPKIRSNNGNLL